MKGNFVTELNYENFVALTSSIEKINPNIFEQVIKESLGGDKHYARDKWEQFNNSKGYRSLYMACRGKDGKALFEWAMTKAGLRTEVATADGLCPACGERPHGPVENNGLCLACLELGRAR